MTNIVTDQELSGGLMPEYMSWSEDKKQFWRVSSVGWDHAYEPNVARAMLLDEYLRWAIEHNDIEFEKVFDDKTFYVIRRQSCGMRGELRNRKIRVYEHTDPLTALYRAWSEESVPWKLKLK